MPNQSTEDYIKSIYKLQKDDDTVMTSTIARHLHISDGSVTDMMKRLSEKKLVRYTPYQGVDLTVAGRTLAIKMMRRHRLWEMYLVKFLDFSWDEVHDEAERLEHVTSEEMEQRLDKALGYPKVDPHGDPIPTTNGEIAHLHVSALAAMEEGDQVEIVRVSDDNAAMLQHATKLGLSLYTKAKVVEKRMFDGSMALTIGKKKCFVSKQLAEAIFVRHV